MTRVCEAKPSLKTTRKERAKNVLELATQGPSISLSFSEANLTPEQVAILEAEIKESYTRWANSWLLHDLKTLIPELK